jgi:hypothetical protein
MKLRTAKLNHKVLVTLLFVGSGVSFALPSRANSVDSHKACIAAMGPETHEQHEVVASGEQGLTSVSLPKPLQDRLKKEVQDAFAALAVSPHLSAKVSQSVVQRAADAADESNNFLQTDPDLLRDFTVAWDGDLLQQKNTSIEASFTEINNEIKKAAQGFSGLLAKIKSKGPSKDFLALVTTHETNVNAVRKQIESVHAEMIRIRSIDNKLKEQESKIDQEMNYIIAIQETLYSESLAASISEQVSKIVQSEIIPSTVLTLNNLRSLQSLITATRDSLEARATKNAGAIDQARANDTKWSAFLTSPDADVIKKMRQQKPQQYRRFLGMKSGREKADMEKEQKRLYEQEVLEKEQKREREKRDLLIEGEFAIYGPLESGKTVFLIDGENVLNAEIIGKNADGTYNVVNKTNSNDRKILSNVKRENLALGGNYHIGIPGYRVNQDIYKSVNSNSSLGQGRLYAFTPDRRVIAVVGNRYEALRLDEIATNDKDLVFQITGHQPNQKFDIGLGRIGQIVAVFAFTKQVLVDYDKENVFQIVPLHKITGEQVPLTPQSSLESVGAHD